MSGTKRVAVTGGRGYGEWRFVFETLDQSDIAVVMTGDASGVDRITRDWAASRGRPLMVWPAHWDWLGLAAGPLRNGWMLRFGKPDLLIAFPGGNGTADCKRQARELGIPVSELETP